MHQRALYSSITCFWSRSVGCCAIDPPEQPPESLARTREVVISLSKIPLRLGMRLKPAIPIFYQCRRARYDKMDLEDKIWSSCPRNIRYKYPPKTMYTRYKYSTTRCPSIHPPNQRVPINTSVSSTRSPWLVFRPNNVLSLDKSAGSART